MAADYENSLLASNIENCTFLKLRKEKSNLKVKGESDAITGLLSKCFHLLKSTFQKWWFQVPLNKTFLSRWEVDFVLQTVGNVNLFFVF